MAEIRIVFKDEDYEGLIGLDVEFNPELQKGMRNEDLTPAQFAALNTLMFIHQEVLGAGEDGVTLADALGEALDQPTD